jgi:sugar phosphate isomerase/epimerase
MQNRKILIPSLSVKNADSLRDFAKYFKETEIDLIGIKQSIDRDQGALLAAFNMRLMAAGMKVYSVHLRNFDISTEDSGVRAKALSFCNGIYSAFQPNLAVIHPGGGSLEALVANLAFMLERTPSGLSIAIENISSHKSILHSPETICKFIDMTKNLPSRLGVCIDTAHPKFPSPDIDATSYTSLVLEHIQAAWPRLLHLHFSDRDRREGTSIKHMPIGEGMIEWNRISEFLANGNYRGKAVIELREQNGLIEKTVSSAKHYYSLSEEKESDLNLSEQTDDMGKAENIAAKEVMLEKAKVPENVARLIDMPKQGVIEEGDNVAYFIVPTASYGKNHADPYNIVSGSEDKVKWASYVFGTRQHGHHISAVLIDKERRIGVEEPIANFLDAATANWAGFIAGVKSALKAASQNRDANHIIHSMGQTKTIPNDDERAWE